MARSDSSFSVKRTIGKINTGYAWSPVSHLIFALRSMSQKENIPYLYETGPEGPELEGW